MLCGDIDETINHIKSEFSELAQKEYKIRHDLQGKMIYWELYKKLKFDHKNKWYMRNPESVFEKKMHIVFWDSKIQTDRLLLARQPDL